MSAAAFEATYADLKLVKTRKVAQVILEIPLERTGEFVRAFGVPNPGEETWCAIARLNAKPSVSEEPERKRFSDLRSSAQAALRCKEPRFRAFLTQEYGPTIHRESDAAECVRHICGVASRSDLDHYPAARSVWETINESYEAWQIAEGHGAAA